MLKKNLVTAILMTLVTTVLLGLAYPLAVTALAQLLFPDKANGQLIRRADGGAIGSRLIGQPFTSPGYFRARPSAAGATGYDAGASTGSNYGPTNGKLIERVRADVERARAENASAPVPVDLVTASVSGLDPHISPAAAEFQLPRVARERGVGEEEMRLVVAAHTEGRQFGLLGERAVNIQHLESLNDVVARTTGVRVRETIPDCFLRRADEVVGVDISVDALRTRLRQGKIYGVEKIEQSLHNFFRKGNLSALRELALRQVASEQATKAHVYSEREGLEQAVIPEKVMVRMASRGSAKKLLRMGSRIAGRLSSDWYAVYVETPREEPGRVRLEDYAALQENIRFAEELGAKVFKLKARRVADALVTCRTFRLHHGCAQVQNRER